MGSNLAPRELYLSWHYGAGLRGAITIWKNYLEFFYHYFSIPVLFATLFSPYKRIYKVKEKPGFSLTEWFDRVTYNSISCVMGAIIRITVITIGLIFLVFVGILGIFVIAFWIVAIGFTFPIYRSLLSVQTIYYAGDFTKPAELLEKLLKTPCGTFFLSRTGCTLRELVDSCATGEALTLTSDCTGVAEAFLMLFDHEKPLRDLLFAKSITREDVVWIFQWYARTEDVARKNRAFWDRDNLLHVPSIGKTWVYGYTPTLEANAQELSDEPTQFYQFVGRMKEIEMIERYLSQQTRNSVALVGESGVGKHPLLQYISHLMKEGRVYPQLEGKRMLMLNLERLFGSEVDGSQRKSTLTNVLDEAASAGNIVLVIDEFDRFIGSGQDRIDMSDVFYHHLQHKRLQLIILLTPATYHQFLKPNNTLSELFELVDVHPMNKEETMDVVSSALSRFESKSAYFLYQGLREMIDQTDRLMKDEPFPEKAITAIDGIITKTKNARLSPAIGSDQVKTFITQKTNVPTTISSGEGQILLRLETELKKLIIGQELAVVEVSRSLRRVRADVNARSDKPIGSFLFLGPTGVGKTETAKALSRIYFGGEQAVVRFDMSEYKDEHSKSQLLGDFATGKVGLLTQELTDHPFSVVLLDEFEKAHKDILNLFLTALDEGYVTDVFGKRIYFTNAIIIATSNAGAEYIRERIQSGTSSENLQKDVIEYVQKEGIFTPELINRFDSVVVFHPLAKADIESIFDLMINRLDEQLFKEHGFHLRVSAITKQRVTSKEFDPMFGGRSLARAIQAAIEDPLAQKILKNEVARGATVEI